MSTFSIDINGDTRIAGIMNELGDVISNPKESLKEIEGLIIKEVGKQFETEGARLGLKWKKLATATVIAKARAGYGEKGILERTGRLKKGFKSKLSTFQVRVYNPISYYQYHQLGGGYLPQRAMLLTPEVLKQEIVSIFVKNIKSAIS